LRRDANRARNVELAMPGNASMQGVGTKLGTASAAWYVWKLTPRAGQLRLGLGSRWRNSSGKTPPNPNPGATTPGGGPERKRWTVNHRQSIPMSSGFY